MQPGGGGLNGFDFASASVMNAIKAEVGFQGKLISRVRVPILLKVMLEDGCTVIWDRVSEEDGDSSPGNERPAGPGCPSFKLIFTAHEQGQSFYFDR